MKSLVQKFSIGAIMAAPALTVFAQTTLEDTGDTIFDLVTLGGQILIALVFLFFIWSLAKYLLGKDQAEAKGSLIWSVVIMFVLFSIWGIIGLLQDTFEVDGGATGTVELPELE